MSAASCLLTEDQFLCSICLDVFTDPVTVPCGHNFCKTCITEHWNINVPYQCPNCKKVFYTKPELRINIFISEMAAQFRQSAQQEASSSSSEQQASKPGEVPCDVCTRTKLKALKSCLVCLVSYCETHLEPHLTTSGLKRHQLIDPVENLEERMCSKHDKLLELFCKTDQTCVCMLCTYSDHKTHDVVPLKEEYEGKKAELMKTEAENQQMIQKRRLKIQEIKRSVELSKEDADREIAGGVQVFTALKESVERSQAELIHSIKEKQRETEKQGEGFIKELEQEISELQKRSSEVEQLSQSEDHLHLLQSFLSLNAAPPTKDWTEVSVRPPSYEGTVVRAVNQLGETLSKQMKKLFEAELKRVQQYAADVTLDPDIVHPKPTQPNDRRQAGFTFSASVAKLGPSMLNWQLATPTAGTAKPATSEGIEDIERLTTGAAAGASSSASSAPVFGLGDAFKKPESAWDCDVCLVQNKDADDQCVACCAPKPGANVEPKGFRLIFSKPAGTWNCDTCLFLNKPDAVKCVACMSAKPACRAPKPGANVEPKGSAASPAPSANPYITPGGRFNFAPPTTFNIRPAMFPTAGQQSLARPRNKTWVQRRK